ncbi:hypothetical protein BD779DRAFT_1476655 [Infundibulicybe gibba]|nr:hypothetical protein BD779DRAFT_1476655 [Infundibulicybe gibba]
MSSSAPQIEPTFEATWGAFVALVYVSPACAYFHKFFHRDHYILKYTARLPFFQAGCLHRVTISFRLPIGLAVGVVVSSSVQGVYVFRVYRFGHNKYLLACWCVLAGIELGTGLAWMVRAAHAVPAWQNIMLNEKSKWPIEMTFTVGVLLDTSIAASTCYQLWRSRMMGLKRTRRVVDKLIRWTIQTGALTRLDSRIDGVSSAVSIAIILTKNLDTKDNSYFMRILSDLWLGMIFLLPNCYAAGLLALLNARTSLDESNTDHLGLPTASLVWMRTSRSIGIPAARSTAIGGTRGDVPIVRVPEPVLPRWFRDFLRHSNGTNLGNLTRRAAIGSTSTPGRWAWTQLRATSPPHFTSDNEHVPDLWMQNGTRSSIKQWGERDSETERLEKRALPRPQQFGNATKAALLLPSFWAATTTLGTAFLRYVCI